MKSISNWLGRNVGEIDNLRKNKFVGRVSMTEIQVEQLADYITDGGGLSGLFSKPESWIASIMYYPILVPGKTTVSQTYLQLGKIKTGIPCQNVDWLSCYFNMGEYYVKRHFNNFADYNGYTQMKIFLPYVGYVDVDINAVLGKWLQFRLRIDYYTGTAVWFIATSDNSIPYVLDGSNDGENITKIISKHSCQMGTSIPVGTSNASDITRNILVGGIKAVGTLAGIALSPKVGAVSTAVTATAKTVRNPRTGRQIKTSTKQQTTTTSSDLSNYRKSQAIHTTIDTATESLGLMRLQGTTSDRINSSLLQTNESTSIHIVIYRPRLKDEGVEYGKLYGYPLGETKKLSELTGYTIISEVHLEGEGFCSATEKEKYMLEEALSEGIIL